MTNQRDLGRCLTLWTSAQENALELYGVSEWNAYDELVVGVGFDGVLDIIVITQPHQHLEHSWLDHHLVNKNINDAPHYPASNATA